MLMFLQRCKDLKQQFRFFICFKSMYYNNKPCFFAALLCFAQSALLVGDFLSVIGG